MSNKSKKNLRGRPTTYSAEIAEKICTAISTGHALHVLCAQDDYPAESTVYVWLQKNSDFAEKYARAREIQADRGVDEMLVIADTDPDAARARNRIDVRKWRASKLAAKRYGDKIQVGGDAENPLSVLIQSCLGTAIQPHSEREPDLIEAREIDGDEA